MISTLKRLQDKKAAQESNGGFTLIELLIVIVVLGILAAVVVFSLGSVTSKSAVSACQADGATVNTAMAAYNANNGSVATTQGMLTSTASGGPYLQSWPANYSHYAFALDSSGTLYVIAQITGVAPTTTPPTGWTKWIGAASCVTASVK
jgi:general secretion pathway protein G